MALVSQILQLMVVVTGQQTPTALAAIRVLSEVLVVLVVVRLHRIKAVRLAVAPVYRVKEILAEILGMSVLVLLVQVEAALGLLGLTP
jgi:hypothetical protein